jgi:hypothetical protein
VKVVLPKDFQQLKSENDFLRNLVKILETKNGEQEVRSTYYYLVILTIQL